MRKFLTTYRAKCVEPTKEQGATELVSATQIAIAVKAAMAQLEQEKIARESSQCERVTDSKQMIRKLKMT